LTIRNLPAPLADALEREKRRRGRSLNQTVIDLLAHSLGTQGSRSNGLGRLAATWDEEDLGEFERAVAPFEQIDEELWK